MDKVERLVRGSSFTLALLWNEATQDFELVNPERVPDAPAHCFVGRGLAFAGVIGLIDGKPRVALEEPIDDHETIAAITQAFLAHLRKNIRWTAPGGTA